jgi:hypothetical protein
LKTYKSQDMSISNQACDLLGERTFADKWGFEFAYWCCSSNNIKVDINLYAPSG